MGGRGGTSGIAIPKSKIIEFPTQKKQSQKWDYRGYKESVDEIETAVNSANTRSKVQKAYRAITDQDKNITAELNRIEKGGGDAGDTNVLLTQRRRLRQLKRKLVSKNV